MGVTYKEILNRFRLQDTLIQLIIVNIVVFILIAVVRVVCLLFDLQLPVFSNFLAVPSNPLTALEHIWTFFTYMFVHYEVFHILFNMLMLYWFGRIFLMYFTSKNLVGVYILGGLAGALFYILIFNTIPYFVRSGDSYMIGASASVTAVIFASAFYNKNLKVSMLFLGQVKIIYIAAFIFILDFVALGGGSNEGGHVAHIGGAVLGYFYATRYQKGKDLTKGLNLLIDWVTNLFKRKPKMRVSHRNMETDHDYNKRKYNEANELDKILDKIKQSGYNSLTDGEKKRLFDESNK